MVSQIVSDFKWALAPISYGSGDRDQFMITVHEKIQPVVKYIGDK